MKVFVINVDKDNKRMESLHDHLTEQDIEYERISAETGPTEEFGNLKHVCHKGVMGCYSSHRKLWRRIIDEDLEMAMILEDDARFTDEAPTILKKVLDELPQDFDILYLGCHALCDEGNDLYSKLLSLLYIPNILTKKNSKTISENLVVPSAPLSTHAYIISNAGAKKALEKDPKTCHVDYDLSILEGLSVYACKPLIAEQIDESNQKTNFPKFANLFLDKKLMGHLNNRLYDIEVLNLTITNIVMGILCAFFPWMFVLLIPDLYDSLPNILTVLLISFILRLL